MLNEQKRQIGIAATIMLAITVVICGLLLWVPYVKGLIGEWLALIVGVVTTPFFMEGSFAIFGLTLVLVLNHLRQKETRDELVDLDLAGLDGETKRELGDDALGVPKEEAKR